MVGGAELWLAFCSLGDDKRGAVVVKADGSAGTEFIILVTNQAEQPGSELQSSTVRHKAVQLAWCYIPNPCHEAPSQRLSYQAQELWFQVLFEKMLVYICIIIHL